MFMKLKWLDFSREEGPVTSFEVGYAVAGIGGAVVSTLAIFGPSLVYVLLGVQYIEKLNRSRLVRAALRVTAGGALAMAVTAIIGRILGVSVG